MFFNKETITQVNELLHLKASGDEQEWPLEVADSDRIIEFLYLAEMLDIWFQIRYAFIALILYSYDKYLGEHSDHDKYLWDRIEKLLDRDAGRFNELLNRWALWDVEDDTDLFRLTPLVRTYLTEFQQKHTTGAS
ncbi:hypothetical protein FHW88_000511 [Mucilaginibacter sp. SG538B]|uniref:hypothetical protein n=1 Tax=Mucilaginibacter sp. SG538B TaxID=2587021 RepID=UPI00159E8C92|nr:hypothetical protein [Mucilaginibacter sp. SG538B]NVM62235.1 hypothetical protein [Mucilaginibacter sp. SG538B]